MSENKFNAPWTYNEEYGEILRTDRFIVAKLFNRHVQNNKTGNLIAAAPEMFEVLESQVNKTCPCDLGTDTKYECCKRCDNGKAYIAYRKAKGENHE